MVARPGIRYRLTYGFDDSRALVAEHCPVSAAKWAELVFAVNVVQVAVANAAGHGTDEHLVAPRRIDLHRFDRQWLECLAQ